MSIRTQSPDSERGERSRLRVPKPTRRLPTGRWVTALASLVLIALVGGAAFLLLRPSAAERAADRYMAAWERADYAAMYELLTDEAQGRRRPEDFARLHRHAADIATATEYDGAEAKERGANLVVPMRVRTRVFGEVRADLVLPMDGEKVAWQSHLVFPGVPPLGTLERRTELPPRARILARGGQVIAEGDAGDRRTPLPEGAEIAGEIGPLVDPGERKRLYNRGLSEDTPVGLTGLERVLEERVSGKPGGTLFVGERILARSKPEKGSAVRTTIDPGIQATATAALGGRFGGIAALDARTGAIRALSGVAFSTPQPPGSIFKIITTAAALEHGKVNAGSKFPVQSGETIDGFFVRNAGGESCGGTFSYSFAHSCNSVFAPLGVEVGAEKLVREAEAFGFNKPASIAGAERSTIPQPDQIKSDLELGTSAIGQGKVLTTPLLMASMAQAIAAGGVRSEPTIVKEDAGRKRSRVTTPAEARLIEKLMIGVVDFGTGKNASLGKGRVAGKTGTAELGNGPDNAWFTSYAPVKKPKLVVAVLIIGGGFGGDSAAPAARQVFEAAL